MSDTGIPQDDLERALSDMDKEIATAPTAPQGSIDWLKERDGHCTGSEVANAIARRKDKKEAARRYNYRIKRVV